MRNASNLVLGSALSSLLAGLSGCGGAAPPPAAPSATSASSTTAPASTPAGGGSASPSAAGGATAGAPAAPAAADEPKPPDPNESPVAIVMTPLFTKSKPPKFPKATVSDQACWQDMELSGESRKDYDALIARCGTPTGVVEYAHPAEGHLHHKHDKRDSFKLKLAGGFCYRYFAVADSTIDDLDILVERYGGDMVADDQVKGPVAIIQSNKPWCMDDDAEYDFDVAVDGEGHGNYVIGVWARPK